MEAGRGWVWIFSGIAHFVARVFASRPPVLRVYSLVSVYLLAYFPNCFSKL